jgi:hypothetical protein
MLVAIPNGSKRDAITGARLKAEGVAKGFPDMVLFVARGGFHGLAIELKVQRGSVGKEQAQWHDDLRLEGYRVEVCYGWESARDIILHYLSL